VTRMRQAVASLRLGVAFGHFWDRRPGPALRRCAAQPGGGQLAWILRSCVTWGGEEATTASGRKPGPVVLGYPRRQNIQQEGNPCSGS
jgi:hypothetical protein